MTSPSKKSKKAPEYVLHYWSARGRGEAIRLTLAICGLEWKEEYVTDESQAETKKKAGSAESPFGQWPLLVEDGTVLCQSQAIVKHLGRQHGLYAARGAKEDYLCDAFILGAEDVRAQLANVRWVQGNTQEAKDKFFAQHIAHESKTGKCQGAHLAFLEGFLDRSETDWVAGGRKMTIADIVLFDLYDEICVSHGAEKIAALYPKCAAHHKTMSELPEIKTYLSSEKRHKN